MSTMNKMVVLVYEALRTRGLSNTCIVDAVRAWFRASPRTADELMEDFQVTGAEAALLYLVAQRTQRKEISREKKQQE